MRFLLGAVIIAAVTALGFWLYDRHATAYDRAMKKDLEYARTHPDCTYEEAHRHRDRVYRRRGL